MHILLRRNLKSNVPLILPDSPTKGSHKTSSDFVLTGNTPYCKFVPSLTILVNLKKLETWDCQTNVNNVTLHPLMMTIIMTILEMIRMTMMILTMAMILMIIPSHDFDDYALSWFDDFDIDNDFDDFDDFDDNHLSSRLERPPPSLPGPAIACNHFLHNCSSSSSSSSVMISVCVWRKITNIRYGPYFGLTKVCC